MSNVELEKPADSEPEAAANSDPLASPDPAPAEPGPKPAPTTAPPPEFGPELFAKGSRRDIAYRFFTDHRALVADHKGLEKYCILSIFDSQTSLSTYELDRVYEGLKAHNTNRDRDVLLLMLSRGGNIESAYQIAKLCKSFSRKKFVVAVPRYAKSAATLVALGADEIHMGPLGHLGPIDPQLDGLPALAVARALETVAGVAERYPKSANMLAQYLQSKLEVPQIGYYERVAESAVQYAQRLLATKEPAALAASPHEIAHDFVHEYKDHGFVIDYDEARAHLGGAWIFSNTIEAAFADVFYQMYEFYEFFVRGKRKTKFAVIGSLDRDDDDLERIILLMPK